MQNYIGFYLSYQTKLKIAECTGNMGGDPKVRNCVFFIYEHILCWKLKIAYSQ